MNFKITIFPALCSLALVACGGGESNQAPTFSSSSLEFSLVEDTVLTAKVQASDSDPLTYSLSNAPSNGIIALEANGTFTYTPNANYFGNDTAEISASDGALSSSTTLTFTVQNTNDAPQLLTSSINVTTSATTDGILEFLDVDGDDITFNLIVGPSSGELELDGQTGEFSYQANNLEVIDDSFEISYTDGIITEPLRAVIRLQPAYVTNEDKRNYYYSSNQSHLKQAQALADTVYDDLSLNEVNESLAVGYIFAGFEQQATGSINRITLLDDKARAYRSVGRALDSNGEPERALEYRLAAQSAFNQYIAEKGIDNISSSDPAFFIGLVNDYRAAGQVQAAEDLLVSLKAYANQVREEEYSSKFGRFLTAFNKSAGAAVDAWLENPSQENFDTAQSIINAYSDLTLQTGYQIQKSGEFAGQPVERLKAAYITWAAELAFQIGAQDSARKLVNEALALYGVVNFDASYDIVASPYAEATLATYTYPLESLAGLISALYDGTPNPAFALLTDERDISDAREHMFAFDISKRILAGESVQSAVSPAYLYFSEDENLRSYLRTLTQKDASSGVALLLYEAGEVQLAQEVLEVAQNLLLSPEYVAQESLMSYTTGYRGCGLLVKTALRIGADAKSAAQSCAELQYTYFRYEAGNTTTVNTIVGYGNVINAMIFTEQFDEVPALAALAQQEIKRLEDPISRFEYTVEMLGYLIDAHHGDIALNWLVSATEDIDNSITSLDAEGIEKISALLLINTLSQAEAETGFYARSSFVTALSEQAAHIQNYADVYAHAHSTTVDLTNKLHTQLASMADKTVQDNMETFVSLYTLLGMHSSAKQLIQSDLNGDADKLRLTVKMADLIANRDDFAGTHIASIDTDHDGQPNFFINDASEEEIELMGLIADTDADNDGIDDANDATPIGEHTNN